MKKVVIFEYSDENIVGTREHMFDWKIGDEIISNGHSSEIINIIDESNVTLVNRLFKDFENEVSKLGHNILDLNFVKILEKCNFDSSKYSEGRSITEKEAEEIREQLYEKLIEELMSI